MAKHDWETIRREYIETTNNEDRPSLQSLASKYGVSFSHIQRICAKEKWVEQSKIYARKLNDERVSQKVTSLASEQTKFDADILIVARGLQRQIIGHINTSIQQKVFLEPKDISSLTGSLLSIQRIGRTALDLDTWTNDKLVNEGLKRGFIISDLRHQSSHGSANAVSDRQDGEAEIAFSDILGDSEYISAPAPERDQQV